MKRKIKRRTAPAPEVFVNTSNRRKLAPRRADMTAEQKRLSMNTLHKLTEHAGGKTHLGRLFGITKQHVQNWFTAGSIPAPWAVTLDELDAARAIGVNIETLRPDLTPEWIERARKSAFRERPGMIAAQIKTRKLNAQGFRFDDHDAE